MGLTKNSMGNKLLVDDFDEIRKDINFTIGLIGNPNVGKSSVFNNLTGLHQHTGNWPGKTIESSWGTYEYSNKKFLIVDLPGTYSLKAYSKEEDVTTSFIEKSQFDVMVVVVDATALERNLNLVLQVLKITRNVVVCVNLLDEAKKKNIKIDLELLSEKLGVPVVGTIATKKKTLEELKIKIGFVAENKIDELVEYGSNEKIVKMSETIANEVIDKSVINLNKDRKIDKILTSKCFGIPIMIAMLGFIFWLTIIGANYPSKFLSRLFELGQERLESWFVAWNFPQFVSSLLINGVYQTVLCFRQWLYFFLFLLC